MGDAVDRRETDDQDVLIVLSRGEKRGATRSSKYRKSRRHTEEIRDRLTAALDEQGLADEAHLGPVTGFSLLTARASSRAIVCLEAVDGVEKVVPITDDQDIDLLLSEAAGKPPEGRGPL